MCTNLKIKLKSLPIKKTFRF
jgi:hypothetical protein